MIIKTCSYVKHYNSNRKITHKIWVEANGKTAKFYSRDNAIKPKFITVTYSKYKGKKKSL